MWSAEVLVDACRRRTLKTSVESKLNTNSITARTVISEGDCYIRSFAEIARPLHELTKKHARFDWGLRREDSYQSLKHSLIYVTVLAMPFNGGVIFNLFLTEDYVVALSSLLRRQSGPL